MNISHFALLDFLLLMLVQIRQLTAFALASSATIASSSTGGAGAHVPVGKDGEGAYTASTKGCFDVIDTATPLILKEIDNIPLTCSDKKAFHIADYGTADAGTSLGLLSKMVQAVRKRVDDEEQEVVLHYEDQAGNEWKSVFSHALGLKEVQDAYNNPIATPYALGNVFIEACGVGFHSQCYASNSIDFGVSFTAMHWLSSFPSSLKGKAFMHAARCPDDEPALIEKEQAAKDWLATLKARVKELVPGGRFACVNFCKSKDGYFLGQTDAGASMWDSFQSAWDQLKTQNLIDEEERLGVSFPNYYRTEEEFMEGLNQIPDIKVISIEEKVVRCPYRELYNSGNTGMSAREYAEWFVPTTRSWSHSTFVNALHADRDDKDDVMAQFWENYISIVEKDPSSHGMDYAHAYIVFEKL